MRTIFIRIFLTLVLSNTVNSINAQSIRKDYREMTEAERDAYVDALWQLWDNGDIMEYEDIHMDNSTPIHRNDIFLPWHRVFLKRYEELIQAIYPQLSIPYWDWTDDNSTTPAWNDNDFLGQFDPEVEDGGWDLDRSLGGSGSLPTASQKNAVLALTSFSSGGTTGRGFGGSNGNGSVTLWGDLELIHNQPHVWVGGIMAQFMSPRDPIFFFHHGFVDKIWQDWTGTSSFTKTSMPEYDLNPNDYIDSRVLNVWYAVSGVVALTNYETNGTNEYFYTGIIESEDFTVASASDVTFTSGSEIILGPGFQAVSGSTFSALISSGGDGGLLKENNNPDIASAPRKIPTTYDLSGNYPNPFNPTTTILYQIPQDGYVTLKVYDNLGREVGILVDRYQNAGKYSAVFNASNLSSGVYVYRISVNKFVSTKKMLLVK